MKKTLISLSVIFILAVAGTYFYLWNLLAIHDVPENIIAVENSLVTQNTIALASLDVDALRRVNEFAQGERDPNPIRSSAKQKDIIQKLKDAGLDLYQDTDFVLATVDIDAGKPAYSLVLFGRFAPEKVKQAINKVYLVEETSENHVVVQARLVNPDKQDPCAANQNTPKTVPPAKLALQIRSDRILITSPDQMSLVLQRVEQHKEPAISLVEWRAFRQNRLVAGTVMSPAEAKTGAFDMPSALVLGTLSKQPLKSVFAGATVKLAPVPSLTLTLDMHANDPAWSANFKLGYDIWLKNTQDELVDMPTLAGLIKTLDVSASTNVVNINATADRTTVANLEKVPAEFFRMIFSQASVAVSNDSATDTQTTKDSEKLANESEIEHYLPQFNLATVTVYDNKDDFHKPDVISGPFAVRLEKAGLLESDNSIVEMTIQVNGRGFENISVDTLHASNDAPPANLTIESVVDANGNDLLRDEPCGKQRNLGAAELQSSRDRAYTDGKWVAKSVQVTGKKSVRLKPGVKLSQVAKLNGKIHVNVATKTRTVTITSPIAGQTIQNDDVRVFFKKSNDNTVNYELSGNFARVMAVRAKNASGQYLASGGSSGMGFDDNKSMTKQIHGKVASVEVVLAESLQSQDYPFTLDMFSPKYGKPTEAKNKIVTVSSKSIFLKNYPRSEYGKGCEKKKQVRLGAFKVCTDQFGDRWNRETGGTFEVYGPPADVLRNNFSAGKLVIDRITTEGGEELSFGKNSLFAFDYRSDQKYNNAKKQWEEINQHLYASNVSLFSDNEILRGKKIKQVKGYLRIRLPLKVAYVDLPANQLGATIEGKNKLTATINAFSDWATSIELRGQVENVLRFMPITADGTVLATGNDRITLRKYQTWGMSEQEKIRIESLPETWEGMITIYGVPEKIRIYYGEKFDMIDYPFVMTVD